MKASSRAAARAGAAKGDGDAQHCAKRGGANGGQPGADHGGRMGHADGGMGDEDSAGAAGDAEHHARQYEREADQTGRAGSRGLRAGTRNRWERTQCGRDCARSLGFVLSGDLLRYFKLLGTTTMALSSIAMPHLVGLRACSGLIKTAPAWGATMARASGRNIKTPPVPARTGGALPTPPFPARVRYRPARSWPKAACWLR